MKIEGMRHFRNSLKLLEFTKKRTPHTFIGLSREKSFEDPDFVNLMLRRGPAVIIFQKARRQFVLNLFTELMIAPTTEGVILCCYDEPLMAEPNFRFASLENITNGCGEIGGVIIVSGDFAEHMLLQRRCDQIKRCHVPVVSAFGYSVLPGPQNVPWADTGVTYPGIFSLAAAYAANLRVPNPSYVEFGAMEGRTVTYAWHFLSRALAHCKYFVFDSFEGIIGSMSSEVDYFHEGSFFANEETFFLNMEVSAVDLKRVTVIKGDIVERCAETSPITAEIDFGNVVLANIDVDIYAPAKAALNFLGRIMADGAMLLFDDYDEMGADKRGENVLLLRSGWREIHYFRSNVTETTPYSAGPSYSTEGDGFTTGPE